MRALLLTGLLATIAFAGCLSDDSSNDGDSDSGSNTGSGAAPVDAHPAYNYGTNAGLDKMEQEKPAIKKWAKPGFRPLPDPITGMIEIAGTIEGISGSDGIAVFGPLAFVGPRTGPLHIVDILDPANPSVISTIDDVPARDVVPILYPNGRLVVITTAGGGDLTATDVTDPANPFIASVFTTPHGNHNVGAIPGSPIVYNFPSSGSYTDIIDYSDPENPFVAKEWQNGVGCHDATWYLNQAEEKYRGYCAGGGVIQIWDITDALNPTVINEIPFPRVEQGLPGNDENPAPVGTVMMPGSISHLAMVNHDASILILGDETGGGAINGCDFYMDGPTGPQSGPAGNLWFYDLSDEMDPELRSHMSPEFYDDLTDPAGSCTSHFGQMVEDTNMLAMSFYTSGILLIDINNVDHPTIVDRYVPSGSDFWDVWYSQGYLFTGDIPNGMQVLSFV